MKGMRWLKKSNTRSPGPLVCGVWLRPLLPALLGWKVKTYRMLFWQICGGRFR